MNPLDSEKYPPHIIKLFEKLETMQTKIVSQKKEMDELNVEFKYFHKQFHKLIEKTVQKPEKPAPKRQCGFTMPVAVSDKLCEFMGREPGAKIARTEVTKYINQYIREHNLKNPEIKTEIILDDKLADLLGNPEKVTFFTLQKFLNVHFIK